jgi:hypothetical protein
VSLDILSSLTSIVTSKHIAQSSYLSNILVLRRIYRKKDSQSITGWDFTIQRLLSSSVKSLNLATYDPESVPLAVLVDCQRSSVGLALSISKRLGVSDVRELWVAYVEAVGLLDRVRQNLLS